MVHIRDEGSRFDGSIETVRRYTNMPELHGKAHASYRNLEVKPEGGAAITLTMERNWMGSWVKVSNRVTLLPPLGTVNEHLAGPFAGSKMFTVYPPEDIDYTRVDVYGEFRSPTLPEAQIEAAVRHWLEEAYNEDAPAIKAFHKPL